MSAVVATDYATERKLLELEQEEERRKGDFWMHMMQFSVVTVFVVEIIWILKNTLSR